MRGWKGVCVLFIDDVMVVSETRKQGNDSSELWRKALEYNG